MVYAILEEARLPERILAPYRKFLEKMGVHNTVAGDLGEAYDKPMGIPHGDPLSMMVTALLLRPQIEQMKSVVVDPRVLAGDLQIITTGPRRLENYVNASDLTHAHLESMGTKFAPKKSVSFSTDHTARKWLRSHRWGRIGSTIPVVTHVRDLGAHFNTMMEKDEGRHLNDKDDPNCPSY